MKNGLISALYLLMVLGMTWSGCRSGYIGKGAGVVKKEISSSEILQDHFAGFALFDPVDEKWLYQWNTDKYFTPASNTKILTFYTALHFLGDSLEAFRYIENDSTLTFWGTASPAFLSPYLNTTGDGFSLLKNFPGKISYAEPAWVEKRFGSGWAWDDYAYGYQVEKSSFPIYANRILVHWQGSSAGLKVSPGYFLQWFSPDPALAEKGRRVLREEMVNAFYYDFSGWENEEYTGSVPFSIEPYLVKELLEDTLGRGVALDFNFIPPAYFKSINHLATDSAYIRLMQESDNFIAEQLLLAASQQVFDTMYTQRMIYHVQNTLLREAPDPFLWYDGSGLSRYNMFTPRALVWLLDQMLEQYEFEYLSAIFPAGGESGTISSWYGAEAPYVFAKTGTLRNRHCLSGYLVADSGRVLIFSFMHNNYPAGSSGIKREMQNILSAIKTKY